MTPAELRLHTLAVLKEPNYLERMHRWTGVLTQMTEENWQTISDALIERYASGQDTAMEGEISQFREGQILKSALAEFLPAQPNGAASGPLQTKVRGWASLDPEGARRWLDSLEEGKAKSTLLSQWRRGLQLASPEAVEGLFPSLASGDQGPLIPKLLEGIGERGGLPAVRAWYEEFAKTADPGLKGKAFTNVVERMAQTGNFLRDDTVAFIKSEAPGLGLGSAAYRAVALTSTQTEPGKCLDLLNDLATGAPDVAENLDSLIGYTVERTAMQDLDLLGNWLNANPAHPLRDRAVLHFVRHCRADDPESAAQWAATITDESLRAQAADYLK